MMFVLKSAHKNTNMNEEETLLDSVKSFPINFLKFSSKEFFEQKKSRETTDFCAHNTL